MILDGAFSCRTHNIGTESQVLETSIDYVKTVFEICFSRTDVSKQQWES